MFSHSAELYDLIYSSFKDYSHEAGQIGALLGRIHPQCRTILDVACGTGEHANVLVAQYGTTTGDKWYVGNLLLDGSLNLLATVGYKFNAGISPDGSVAYVPTWYGYDKIALPSGAVLERARIQALGQVTAQRITVFPDGNRLFMWDDLSFGTNHATVVDLTH